MDFYNSIDDSDNWINDIFDNISDQSSSPVSNFTYDDSAYSSPDNLTNYNVEKTIDSLICVENVKNENFTNKCNDYCFNDDYSVTGIEGTIFSDPNSFHGDNTSLGFNWESPNYGENPNLASCESSIFDNFLLDNVLDTKENLYLNSLTDEIKNFERDRRQPIGSTSSSEFCVNGTASTNYSDGFKGVQDFKYENSEATDVLSDVDFYRLCPELKFEETQISGDNLFTRKKSDEKKPFRKMADEVKIEDGGTLYSGCPVQDRDSGDCTIVHEVLRNAHQNTGADTKIQSSYSRFTLTEALFAYPPLKEGIVILTDEEKRSLLEEGLTLPLNLPLKPQDAKMLKKIRRKIKNRMAAQESRRKQKEYLELMESRMEIMRKENCQLKEKLCLVENSNRNLSSQLENCQNMIRFSGFAKNKTCLMVLVIMFAVSMGTWSPSSLNLGRVLISKHDVLAGLGPYLPSPEKGIGEDRLIGPDAVQPSVQYYFQVQDKWKDANKEETTRQEFYYQPLIPSHDFCFGNLISYIKSYKNWNSGFISQAEDM